MDQPARPTRVIDGARFDDLDGFYDEVARQLIPDEYWGRNLDAFNDILRGGFGTPVGGFVLRWDNSERSRRVLGHAETARHLERVLTRCHPDNVAGVQVQLEAARRGEGPTLFEVICGIVREHGSGGSEAEDGVALELG